MQDMSIGESIRLARKNQNLTQKKLAELSGVAEISIRQYEGGKRQPQFDKLVMLAKTLNVPLDRWFVSDSLHLQNEFSIFEFLQHMDFLECDDIYGEYFESATKLINAVKGLSNDDLKGLIQYAEFLKSKGGDSHA